MKYRLLKSWSYTLLLSGLGSVISGASYAALSLSDLPLFIQSNIPPNTIVTVDDSGSMAWGYLPDEIYNSTSTTYYRSAHYNGMYYDPTIIYEPPKTSVGSSVGNALYTKAIRGYYYSDSKQRVVNLSTQFRAIRRHYSTYSGPTLLGNSDGSGTFGAQPAYYYNYNDSLSGCNSTATDSDCYEKVVIDTADYSEGNGTNAYERTLAEEQTNFANWYQYYGIRGDAAKTALTRAFVPTNIDSSVRVGRQALNQYRGVHSGAPNASVSGVAALSATERANFYNWIKAVPTSSATPLRAAVVRAGEYVKTDHAYTEPNSGDIAACRLNTHILLTDGVYNGGFTSPANYKHDTLTNTLPDGTAYDVSGSDHYIYENSLSTQSLADLTFHYWASDLYDDGDENTHNDDNNLEPFYLNESNNDYWAPQNDPATWQHMVTYVVSFGLTGNVPADETTYNSLLTGASYTGNNGATSLTGWPSIGNSSGKIDDIYHAGINGRGGFFSAKDPDALVDAFGEIVERITDRQASASTVVANSGRISSGSLIYIASFDTGKWLGQLEAFEVSDGSDFVDQDGIDGSNCDSNPLGTFCGGAIWDAGKVNVEASGNGGISASDRSVFSYNSALATPSGVDFKFGNLNGSYLSADQINYLRGDSSNEQKNGGTFKNRTGITSGSKDSRFGPVIHSSPVYVGNGLDANGVRQFAFPEASYTTFLGTINNRPPVIYVGGNDGMLHAINARKSGGGGEIFAYVPEKVIPKLSELTDANFQSGAYVDGPITVKDADAGGWKTLLVGGLRTGGQGYYVLDVTDPDDSASDIAAWEFTDADDADMGFSFGEAQIVKSNLSGKWVVIVGNGYNSTIADGNVGTGQAVLYVLDAETGAVLKRFPVGGTTNGMSSPVALSTDSDFTADVVYAGDLEGNMWRFDISGSSVSDWTFSKLYSSGSNQPVTARPTVGSHPANLDGRIVYYGTGSYMDTSDPTTTAPQAFYALWDRDDGSEINAGALQSQSVTGGTVTDEQIEWFGVGSGEHKGWKLTLTSSSTAERVVQRAFILGDVLLFPSLIPDSDVCNAGGTAFLTAIDRASGGLTENQIFDIDGDGDVDKDDKNGDDVDPRKEVTLGPGSTATAGSELQVILTGKDPTIIDNIGSKGRVRWRQLK